MAFMIKKYSSIRLMTLVYLPCVVAYCPLAVAEVQNIAANIMSPVSSAKAAVKNNNRLLEPTLVGILVNEQEQGSIDALYDSESDPKRDAQKNHYFVSINDLSQLTKVSFLAVDKPTIDSGNDMPQVSGYEVSTPIGNVQLSADELVFYQGQDYVSLGTLKKLGITATYSQPDLAIMLNMGWRPSQIGVSQANDKTQDLPIDYRPESIGLLGLSFNSTLSASENNGRNDTQTTSRQMYADLGAYGYALGGVWGVKAIGYDYDIDSGNVGSGNNKISNDDSFVQNALNGLTYSPSKWDEWEIDNLYWAKSDEKFATRLGINQPNSLGQGAQTAGGEFTGALIAYSNQNVSRHLSYFDEDSRSLLQNTSQDYQHLTGIGEAGGVAELRISGRAIARVQIGLDGRYEFLNLDVSQLSLTETLVEVAIYAYPLARQPLEIRPIVLGKRRTNAATDELLIEAGVGKAGNQLSNNDRNSDKDGTAAHLYAEYGINNRLAVRAGVNNNVQSTKADNDSLSWHTGANYSLSPYTNADLSYANTPTQDLWQAQLQYQRKKLWAYYQYQAKYFDDTRQDADQSGRLHDQRHQLLVNYSPSDKTNISVNQYYDDMAAKHNEQDDYYAYTSINHRFSDALNAGANWNSRDDRYGYRLSWRDTYKNSAADTGTRNTIGLSGDNDSDTLSLRHELDYSTSLGQSISVLHEDSRPLYQGDISYRFDGGNLFGGADIGSIGANLIDNQVSVGYSLFDGQVGWLADWQLTHRNGVSFSLGYKHRYVDAVSSNRYTDLVNEDLFINERELPAWTQNNYLFAKLSFDMFKPPRQNLKFGYYPRQEAGSVVVDLNHEVDSPIDHDTMRFMLDDQEVQASLLGTQANYSQYLIDNIKAGDYTLAMDAKNLPIEYSASELQTPRIRVSNYAPTSVPIKLEKTYGVSGKLVTAKEGVVIDIYQQDALIQSVTTGSYGYFQAFGLAPDTYILKAKGYQAQSAKITDDFVIGVELVPEPLHQ